LTADFKISAKKAPEDFGAFCCFWFDLLKFKNEAQRRPEA
jgi:hypothetical protein